ncbi:MAG: CaiB/BaiF CoA transferase family protein [Flavobacteriaceae bacterium]
MSEAFHSNAEGSSATSGAGSDSAALAGIKVVEFAHVIAGPMAGTLLADLGADVIHVEPPGTGEAGRAMGPTKDGKGIWWKVIARNKRSVTLDLRRREVDGVIRRLIAWADVVIVNLRAKSLKEFGIDRESIQAVNPMAVILQISGQGAHSPNPNAPGFGKVGEAQSGVVFVTGEKAGSPIHTGFSHADTVTALMGAFAITAALNRRWRDENFQGEWIDLALYEGLFRLLDWQVPVYHQLGILPERNGNRLAVAPAAVINTYMTAGNEWLTVTSGTPKSVSNIARLMGLPAEDYDTPEKQFSKADFLDQQLREWLKTRNADEALAAFEGADVVASRIFSVKDILKDPTYAMRENIVEMPDADFGSVKMPNVVPKLSNHGGSVWRTGPSLGADTEEVLKNWLGVSEEEYDELSSKGLI